MFFQIKFIPLIMKNSSRAKEGENSDYEWNLNLVEREQQQPKYFPQLTFMSDTVTLEVMHTLNIICNSNASL